MTLERNKLYAIIFMACLAGYLWLYFNMTNTFAESKLVAGCLIKRATDIPCPSCGSTRSVVSITQGAIFEALHTNPMGFVVAIIMLISPLWIIIDIASRKKTLFVFYQNIETYLKKPKYAVSLISLVLINWVWNIAKGL